MNVFTPTNAHTVYTLIPLTPPNTHSHHSITTTTTTTTTNIYTTTITATTLRLQSKNDLAQDLCRKTLLENKSCSQAWEILGLIFEKDANYELASDAYAKVRLCCVRREKEGVGQLQCGMGW